MAAVERDPVTGRQTTGHDWNGIAELDTPIPKVVIFFLVVTFLFSLVWWILMPAWPLITTYTRGALGIDQRTEVEESIEAANAARSIWLSDLAAKDWSQIQADGTLMAKVKETGHRLFGDNCAVCHGASGKGGPGFPDLTDGDWIWGGDPDAIAQTLRVGVNSTAEDTRTSQMPAFGRDGILDRTQISDVAFYVRSLSDPSLATPETADRIANGKEVFAANCVSCHGEDARGNVDLGAPNLTDSHWLYGGSANQIVTTIFGGRMGHMPNWGARLAPEEIKMLALYVATMGGETQFTGEQSQ
ncbi:cytochrome-c oxidase, cbb3-type subunit III [Sinorhizobium mexicanum]|uniref:Cbb3-type cytochrome c oxidase subunit n=1 Tax=Sinorhizobium mexicanum TaxID=375549 RepID=A0A859QFT6_9HYPH|nr:cytochrome-c oxidase, cbb3-type subunit III [Sinorhizobium mexicanum]MBP1888227.1 cytochrome c oxidase cbb3-type subunit 3 [Sinorhizobium mexicanum]QLL64132.1 cytochrome-c oxidase, cbb3-type subunit III [Sinorhizobium mexicanum]